MITIDIIKSHPKVLEAFGDVYDLEFADPSEKYDLWFSLESGLPIAIFALDASGGIFAQCGITEIKPILHVTSEGQAGIIGHHLQEVIQIITALPYWRDHLKFSGGGRIEEMRRAAPLLEREIQADEPEIDQIREMIFGSLELERLDDPVAALHNVVSALTKQYQTVDKSARRLEALFNKFVVTDNPHWKSKK